MLPNVTLLVNNFNETTQIEAPYQPPHGTGDYAVFTPFACTGTAGGNDRVLGVVDNRYSNGACGSLPCTAVSPSRRVHSILHHCAGADSVLVSYLAALATTAACGLPNTTNPAGLSLDRTVYAGCEYSPHFAANPGAPTLSRSRVRACLAAGNTDGNTIGDAVSAAVMSHYFAAFGPAAAERRQLAHAALAAYEARVARCGAGRPTEVANAPSDGPYPPLAPCSGACAAGYRVVLRFAEDNNWQAQLRQTVEAYVDTVRPGWDAACRVGGV